MTDLALKGRYKYWRTVLLSLSLSVVSCQFGASHYPQPRIGGYVIHLV